MTRDELYALHTRTALEALGVMRKKNIDYASEADPFRNFRTFGLLGIVVRMSDKIARLHSLVERGVENNAVKDESYTDTLLDLINYAVIFKGLASESAASPLTAVQPPSGEVWPTAECRPGCPLCREVGKVSTRGYDVDAPQVEQCQPDEDIIEPCPPGCEICEPDEDALAACAECQGPKGPGQWVLVDTAETPFGPIRYYDRRAA